MSKHKVYYEPIVENIREHHRLGRHIEHDPRSKDHPWEAKAGHVILPKVEHARRGGPFNQGDLGSCTGNAAAGVCNTNPTHILGHHLLTEVDAVSIYEDATLVDAIPGSYPPDDTGSSGLAVMKVLKTRGLISAYKHAFSLNAAVQALQKTAVIAGVPWYEGFDSPNTHGLVQVAGNVRGGHEFEIFYFDPGVGSLLDAIVGAWNSWGNQWGLGGKFFFTVRTLGTLLEQQGDVTIPIPVAS